MNVLNIKDINGNWVGIPALKGEPGAPTDTQVQNAVDDYLDGHPAVTGTFTNSAKHALISLLEKVAYIDAQGQTYLDALAYALNPASEYPCTNTLTGCTTSNNSFVVYDGDSYSATIIPNPGYTLTGATVSVTMGGEAAQGAYSNGVITIANVTGAIAITITAASLVSSISAVFTQGSATIYTTDTLDTLEQYLVVTATYSDSTTAAVTDYTLSGALTAGTATITASYGGKTDTFDVTVSSEYQLVEYLETAPTSTSNGAWIDSGITCPTNPSSITFIADCAPVATTWSKCIIGTRKLGGGANDIGFQLTGTTANNGVGGWSGDPGAYLEPDPFTKRATYEATWTSSGLTITDGENTNSNSYSTRSIGGYPICIFACKNVSTNGYSNCFKGRIYSAKIIVNNVVAGEYVPCYRISDSAVGFYDLTNGRFCGVSGGSLISAGPDVT